MNTPAAIQHIVRGACPHDCPDTCALKITVEAGRVVKVAGDPDHPPTHGAQVVAKAWAEPDFKAWLLEDATAAIASLGFTGRQGEHMVAVENTPEQHNMVVCTLCSCYPWTVLGLPPVWYKSAAYRSRAVIEPRKVLADFGVSLPENTRIRVWDSTAEVRYLVLPKRPHGTDHLSTTELAGLVTRDAMIGTALI